MFRTFTFLLLITCIAERLSAQRANQLVLPLGKYAVGFKQLTIPCPVEINGNNSIELVLNLWYPTADRTGQHTRILDYTFNNIYPASSLNDSIKDVLVNDLRKDIRRWFGEVNDENWEKVEMLKSASFENANVHAKKFPLIAGRIRIFSNTFTNEFVASHGYVVCMINAVEDYPPDNEQAYHKQVTNEITFFPHVKKYLQENLKLTTGDAGLIGFSGSGLSQFIAMMNMKDFSALALIESGVYLDGLFEIISRHPGYAPQNFTGALLFLYNKRRLEKLANATNLPKLKTVNKHVVLFDSENQHHWDFASEGTLASLFAGTRSNEARVRQIKDFNTMNDLIVRFFDHYLKKKPVANFKNNEQLIIN
jgi:hypothetical protein